MQKNAAPAAMRPPEQDTHAGRRAERVPSDSPFTLDCATDGTGRITAAVLRRGDCLVAEIWDPRLAGELCAQAERAHPRHRDSLFMGFALGWRAGRRQGASGRAAP